MISFFERITHPRVIKQCSIKEVLRMIKHPIPEVAKFIEQARYFISKGDIESYKNIKENLPCVTFNFSYKDWKSIKNITGATGYIYIDLDGMTEINLQHPLIFASWISLSGKGRGILVKTHRLNHKNYKYTYDRISEELEVKSDKHARKESQFTILSHDSNIYVNYKSKTWNCIKEFKNSPNSKTIKKRKKKDAIKVGEKDKINYDNICDLDFDDNDYLFYPKEKVLISKAWIPFKIKIGSRNNILGSIAHQFKVLNPELSFESFSRFIKNINSSRCEEPLKLKELSIIIDKTFNSPNLELINNWERRIIFNPNSSLSKSEKIKIRNALIGGLRSKKTFEELKAIVLNWNYAKQGKITQKKLAEVSGRNIKTIEKYYPQLKLFIFNNQN